MVDYRIVIEKDVVDWIVATIPLIGLIITVYIAVLQYKLSKRNTDIDERNLKFTLYTERKKVYDTIKTALSEVMRKAHFELSSYSIFLRNTRDAEFLFGNDVRIELELIRKNLIEIHSYRSRLEGVPVGDKRNEVVEKHSKLLEWVGDEFEVLSKLFAKYLKID